MKWILPALFLSLVGCDTIRAVVIERYPIDYKPEGGEQTSATPQQTTVWPASAPKYTGSDEKREHVSIKLTPILQGLKEPTDLIFFPGSSTSGFAIEKGGRLSRFNSQDATHTTVAQLDVLTKSEQGLLGIALHPHFSDNGKLYLHASVRNGDDDISEITVWTAADDRTSIERGGTLLTVSQPYANHNAGQLAFGPDGMLYIGFGDGGWRNDPHDHGQNGRTILGSMLRIDVDNPSDGRRYSIPADNPWVDDDNVIDEAWAIGLRNPWKFSFTPDGKMVLADVGQNAFEEVNVVTSGDNLGWNIREARHCFPPKSTCRKGSLIDPIFEYPHAMGSSITGGFIHTSDAIPQITGDYVFGDFVSGRLWAITIPQNRGGELVQAKSLGQWPFLPSTFARDAHGRLYVADYGRGSVYRLDPN